MSNHTHLRRQQKPVLYKTALPDFGALSDPFFLYPVCTLYNTAFKHSVTWSQPHDGFKLKLIRLLMKFT